MGINEDMKIYFHENEIKKMFDDEIKFKLKLNLSEDSYRYLSNVKNLEKFSASLAAGLATAATGYLAWLATLGFGGKILLAIGLASNPIGWYALAGVGGAALMYGGKTLIDKFDKEAHDKIPKFLNTPLDYLGQNLVNIVLPMVIKISTIDGKISEDDQNVIIEEFNKWGYDKDFLINEINKISSYLNNLNITDTKNKIEVICKEVNGLTYEHLKKVVQTTLEDIFEQKKDKTNFRELNKLIQTL